MRGVRYLSRQSRRNNEVGEIVGSMKIVLSVVPSTASLITEGDVDERVYQESPILNSTVLLQQGTLTHKLISFSLKFYQSIQIATGV